jgi:hypothetical protein
VAGTKQVLREIFKTGIASFFFLFFVGGKLANYMLDIGKRKIYSTSTLMTRYLSSFLLCLVEVSEPFTSHRGALILYAYCGNYR